MNEELKALENIRNWFYDPIHHEYKTCLSSSEPFERDITTIKTALERKEKLEKVWEIVSKYVRIERDRYGCCCLYIKPIFKEIDNNVFDLLKEILKYE